MRKKIIIAIAVLVGIGLAVLITRREAPSPLKVPEPILNPAYKDSTFGRIRYTGAEIDVPEKAGVYQNQGLSLEETAIEIARKLGLTQSSFSAKVWVGESGLVSLSLSSFTSTLQYTVDQTNVTPTRPELSKSLSAAKNFLSQYDLDSNLATDPVAVKYHEGAELVETTPEKADTIAFSFQQQIEGLPVNIDIYNTANITLFTNGYNEIVKAIFPPKVSASDKLSEVKLTTFKEALKLVEESKGSLVQIITEEGRLVEKSELGDINLTKASLEYRLDTKENNFYPYFKFEGLSLIKNTNQSASVVIILPAFSQP